MNTFLQDRLESFFSYSLIIVIIEEPFARFNASCDFFLYIFLIFPLLLSTDIHLFLSVKFFLTRFFLIVRKMTISLRLVARHVPWRLLNRRMGGVGLSANQLMTVNIKCLSFMTTEEEVRGRYRVAWIEVSFKYSNAFNCCAPL